MRMPGFTAESSFSMSSARHGMTSVARSRPGFVLQDDSDPDPRSLFLPPALHCFFEYLECNSGCSNASVAFRANCYSYCWMFYQRCQYGVPVPGR